VKWGILPTEEMNKRNVLEYLWSENNFIHKTLDEGSEILSAYQKETSNIKKVDTEIRDRQRIRQYSSARAPALPNKNRTNGGPIYMSVGEEVVMNKTVYKEVIDEATGHASMQSFIETEKMYTSSNAKVEYYYYKQPEVKKIEPNMGLINGGTLIELSGINFAYRPEYGVVPHCKIGNKVSRAHYYSTVRIVCVSPPNGDIITPQPIYVSLNGVDFIDSGFFFNYYE
jgi:hypothetical protein